MRVGLKFHLFRTPLNEVNISNIRFTKPTKTFVCCPRFYFFFKNISNFALFILLLINPHNFGAREDILSVPN